MDTAGVFDCSQVHPSAARLFLLPLEGCWGEHWKSKSKEKLVCWDKNSLIKTEGKKGENQKSDAKADWCLTSLRATGTWERLSPSFIAEHDVMWRETMCRSDQVSCLGSTTCWPPGHPLLTCCTGDTERPAVAETLVCYQRCFSHRPETQHHAGCSEEN